MAFSDDFFNRQATAAGVICKVVSANPPSIAAAAAGLIAVPVAGAVVGMRVWASLGTTITTGLLLVSGVVTAAGVVTLHYYNASAAPIDQAAHNVNLWLIPGDIN